MKYAITFLTVLTLVCPASAKPLWTAEVPKLGAEAYQGKYGWHETVSRGGLDISRSEIPAAIWICRSHQWRGYVRWESAFGRETDSCEFMKVVSKP